MRTLEEKVIALCKRERKLVKPHTREHRLAQYIEQCLAAYNAATPRELDEVEGLRK